MATGELRKGVKNNFTVDKQHIENFAADRTPEAAQKKARVVELRRQRITWPEIAKAVGVNATRARKLYNEALAEIPAQHVDEHRAEELLLIDDAVADLMIIAKEQSISPRSRIEAWSVIRSWAERKAKLLGLDAPTQVVTIDRVDQEIAALTRELEALEAAGVDTAENDPDYAFPSTEG
jgi:hypothetical protein